MAENTIQLRNIRSLSGLTFYIPDYQRGYRWSKSEAEQMLNDFKEFCNRILKNDVEFGEFYCLQPIVVKKKIWERRQDGRPETVEGYEVIDGQQRLTTLYILLRCIEDVRRILYKSFQPYSINYETRLAFDSQKFLESIDTPAANANDFIDFYYMKEVYDMMVTWMGLQNDETKIKIVDALLKQNIDNESGADHANNIRVIWYEVSDEEQSSSIDIFTRLNIGKIPLTNAELIKALLLRRGNFIESESTMRQLQISAEWNHIEQRLQDDAFWYFLYRTTWPFKYQNRIEFLFDLMKGRTKDSEAYFTFNEFNKELGELSSDSTTYRTMQARIEYIWLEVKKVFQTFEEWYEDRTLYHYIGFLIEYGADINELKKQSLKLNKTDFLHIYIKQEVRRLFRKIELDDLNYPDGEIRKVLLLFNILTVLHSNKSDMRFPFSKYKMEKWDIEHISSRTDKQITEDSQRQAWIDDMLEFFVGSSASGDVEKFIDSKKKEIAQSPNKNQETISRTNLETELKLVSEIYALTPGVSNQKRIDENAFNDIFDAVQKYCGEDKLQDKDSLYNLTLLDAETNRGYGNAFFPIKRKRIISNDRHGIFVPIATKNVFLKYYSHKGSDMMFWEESDARDYYAAIEETLKEYLK